MLAVEHVPERWIERRLRRRRCRSPACLALAAVAMPEISPPPPIGTTSTSRSGASSSISSAIGALARDDLGVVVGMHPGQAALARDPSRRAAAPRDGLAVEHDLGAVGPGRRDLHERRRHRHHHGRRNAERCGVIGDRLGVVAGRHRDHAARALGGRQRGKLGARAALLERVGDLQVLVFDQHLGAGQRRQLGRRQHRGAQHMPGDDLPCGFNVCERDGQAGQSLKSDILDCSHPGVSCSTVSSVLLIKFHRVVPADRFHVGIDVTCRGRAVIHVIGVLIHVQDKDRAPPGECRCWLATPPATSNALDTLRQCRDHDLVEAGHAVRLRPQRHSPCAGERPVGRRKKPLAIEGDRETIAFRPQTKRVPLV